jgi:hypothetical protein
VQAEAVRVVSQLRHGAPLTAHPINDIVRQLDLHAGEGSNGEIRRHIAVVWNGLQDPELVGRVVADIWAEAHRVLPADYTQAVVRLSERATPGRRVVTIPHDPDGLLDADVFFTRYAGTGQRFLDRNADSIHGASTHLIQDLVVDRALAGAGLRAEQFRALLPRAHGPGNIPFGDRIWRALWDAERPGAINAPESLMTAVRQILAGIE